MPPTPQYPGVYVEEVPSGVRVIADADTSVCVFVGRCLRGPLASKATLDRGERREVFSFSDFERQFGGGHAGLSVPAAVAAFFRNGGSHVVILRLHAPAAEGADPNDTTDGGPLLADDDYLGHAEAGTGLHALRRIGPFNLLCIPPDVPEGDTAPAVYQAALALCVEHRAMLLVDPPAAWDDPNAIARGHGAAVAALGLGGEAARNAALYFPRLLQYEPGPAVPVMRVPCGAVAGVIARTDSREGVWKAPAGAEAGLVDVVDLAFALNDEEQGLLNPLGVNALRTFTPHGKVVWGARTLRGDDAMGDEYKYVPVRRTALHIEQSVLNGIAWAVFEPNDAALWAQLRLAVGSFMHNLFRQGAFAGATPDEAYFVQCDAQTTTQGNIDRGLCQVLIGFAPLKPAEFLVLQMTQNTLVPGV